MEFLLNFISSQTVGLAISLIPILATAFSGSKADQWVYDHMPSKWKEKGTFPEFKNVIVTGKAFLKACYDFTHK